MKHGNRRWVELCGLHALASPSDTILSFLEMLALRPTCWIAGRTANRDTPLRWRQRTRLLIASFRVITNESTIKPNSLGRSLLEFGKSLALSRYTGTLVSSYEELPVLP